VAAEEDHPANRLVAGDSLLNRIPELSRLCGDPGLSAQLFFNGCDEILANTATESRFISGKE
jgi:hypothetical protein